MAQYTSGVAEKFMAPEKLPVGWPWKLLVFSLILFALVILVYLGIILGYQPYLQNQKQSLDKKINEIGGVISETDRENFINFFSQLANIEGLLNSHIKGSNIYSFLEKNTNQGVYYEGADLSVTEHSLRLEGLARSYDNLVQQLVAFEQAPEINRVILEQSQLGEQGIRFSLKLIIKNEIFN
jgi:hypothetical protein